MSLGRVGGQGQGPPPTPRQYGGWIMPSCPLCDRDFSTNQGLISHTEAKHGKANVHQGVRAWESSRAQTGELTTGRSAGQYAYEVTHNDYCEQSDTWDCSICQREFNSMGALEQHLNSGVHEGDLYRCQGCERTFRNLSSLNQHVTMTDCSTRAARQVRTLLDDASRQQGLLQITDQSYRAAPPEGTLFFDGGASPNPGCGGGGFQLLDERSHEVARKAVGIYPYTNVTNNQAEYIGLIAGLLEAEQQGMRRLAVKGDSKLVINQMDGTYDCHSDKLISLRDYANEIERRFQRITYTWIPRNQNTVADALASLGKTDDADEEMTLKVHRDPPVWYN